MTDSGIHASVLACISTVNIMLLVSDVNSDNTLSAGIVPATYTSSVMTPPDGDTDVKKTAVEDPPPTPPEPQAH